MDIAVLIALAAGLAIIITVLTVFSRRFAGKLSSSETEAPRAHPVRRAAGAARNARRRMRVGAEPVDEVAENDASDEAELDADDKTETLDAKLGAKKRAKLEAKAERRIARETAEREREERKKKEQLANEESEKQREKEREEELKREEAETKAREEKEKREHEEYLKMKEAFSVEEEGYNAEENDSENLLRDFVDHIRLNKVVVLEDLAAHFGIKTAAVIDRIRELQTNGTLTGVIDDRGKFIYVSQSELEDVARFVRQRGRVSITELAENSNRLISLNPEQGVNIVATN